MMQADAAGDQVGVKVRVARSANQFGQVRPNKWFAAGKTNLQHAQRSGFPNDAPPFVGGELPVAVAATLWATRRFAQRSGYRIRAVWAMQRTTISDLREECVWARSGHTAHSFTFATGFARSALGVR